MNKNYKTKASQLTNDSLVILAIRIIETVNQSGNNAARTSRYFLQLVESVNSYKENANSSNMLLLSKAILLLFNKRKALFDDVYDYLAGLLKSPEESMKVAAVQLFDVVSRFGQQFYKVKIADQSLRYMRIIETLKKAEYEGAITKTLLTDRLSQLDDIQMEYENLYMGRGNDKSMAIAPTTIRKEIEAGLKLFYDEMCWNSKLIGTAEWMTLCRNIESRFDEMSVTRVPKTPTPLAVVS